MIVRLEFLQRIPEMTMSSIMTETIWAAVMLFR